MDVDELYLTPPDRFVAARNALAKAHPEVKALKRPTPSAWLLNVLARKHAKTLEKVFHAGDELRAAQDRVLAGEDPEALQSATRDVRIAIAHAIDACRTILAAHDRREDEALLKKVSSLLRAASVDPQVRESVQSGRLLADPGEEEVVLLDRLAETPRAKPRRAKEAAIARAKAKLEEAQRAEEEARRAYVEAEDELTRVRRELDSRERAFERARSRLDEAKADTKAASAALDDASAGE